MYISNFNLSQHRQQVNPRQGTRLNMDYDWLPTTTVSGHRS